MLLAAITTERDQVKITGLLIADERTRHCNILNPHLRSEMWGTLVHTWATRHPQSDLGHPPA